MPSNIATATVQIIPTTKGIKGGIEKELKGNEVGSNVGKTLGKALKVGAVASLTGLSAIIGKSITAGGELEQQLGGAEAVFQNYAKTLVETSKTSFKTMGLSQNDFLQGANKMGSLFKGSGHDVESSMKMSSTAMQRASDVASIMGISTNDALESVAGMAKGNFTMMDNLGVAMNATTLESYALEKGITKSWNAMSNEEKTGLAYQMFMEKTADYAGNYAKENDTLAGSLNTLKTGFSTLLGQLGQGEDITKTMDGIKSSLSDFLGIAVESAEKIAPEIAGIFSELAPVISNAISKLLPIVLPAFLEMLGGIASALVGAAPQIFSSLVDVFFNLDLGTKLALGVVAGFKGYNLVSGIAPLLAPLKSLFSNIFTKMPAVPTGGGGGLAVFLQSLASGLSAFANPSILLGAAVLAGAMAILSVGVWASIKIISNALPDLSNSLATFNTIDGVNLLSVGAGLTALGLGLVALTGGGIVDALASFVGLGFENTLKSIIEPIATLMPTINEGDIAKFGLLGAGLASLGAGFATISGFSINGVNIANQIRAINTGVTNATANGVAAYTMLKTQFVSLRSSLSSLSGINVNTSGIISSINNLKNNISTLGNFNWSGPISRMKSQASNLGNSLGDGFRQGISKVNLNNMINSKVNSIHINSTGAVATARSIGSQIANGVAAGLDSAYGAVEAAATRIINKVNEAMKAKAEIHSPSKLFEREIGAQLAQGTINGLENTVNDYKPTALDTLTKYSYSDTDYGSNNSQIVFPSVFTLIDGNLELKMKAIADEKITRNNIDYAIVG